MTKDLFVRKADGSLERFQPEKLRYSLEHSGAHSSTVDEVLHRISDSVQDGASTDSIYKQALVILKKEKPSVASRYSLKRALFDLGPTGFPFEDFVSQMLKGIGYETATRQSIKGRCITHEVDLIAHKDGRRIGAELKFHNSPGLKTDVKVVLYVRARFDDIEQAPAGDGHTNHLDEKWLITNTKFTSQAIEYGACAGLMLIGWSYPEKGNLREIVEASGLHPLTCLTTLSTAQKQILLSQGHVLCRSVGNQPEVLKEVGVSDRNLPSVLSEIYDLCRV